MVNLAVDIREGVGQTSDLARQLISAKDDQNSESIRPTSDRQVYNAVAYKNRKTGGPPVVTVANLLAAMSEQFPEGSDETPSDTVIRADLGCELEDPDTFFAFLTTLWLLMNWQKQGDDVLQVDGTYKLMYENNTVLTLGISDRH
uniref:Uncharacterized protein n=1 Tax=Plectus sambesii TaxID=2011161 RepID=A0A914WLQ2_9BILA